MENLETENDVGDLVIFADDDAKILRNCDGDCSCHAGDCDPAN